MPGGGMPGAGMPPAGMPAAPGAGGVESPVVQLGTQMLEAFQQTGDKAGLTAILMAAQELLGGAGAGPAGGPPPMGAPAGGQPMAPGMQTANL